jgi:hypothetical protein
MRPAISDAGALEEIVDAVPDVDFIALFRYRWLARGIVETYGTLMQAA